MKQTTTAAEEGIEPASAVLASMRLCLLLLLNPLLLQTTNKAQQKAEVCWWWCRNEKNYVANTEEVSTLKTEREHRRMND